MPQAVTPSPPGVGSVIAVGGRSRRSASLGVGNRPRREQPADQFGPPPEGPPPLGRSRCAGAAAGSAPVNILCAPHHSIAWLVKISAPSGGGKTNRIS